MRLTPLVLLATAVVAPHLATAQIPATEYAARRARLAERLGDGVFVARGAEEPVQDYNAFYQSAGFAYLTGYREPGASLIMTRRGNRVDWTLFVLRKEPSAEVWSGVRNGRARATELTGIPARDDRDFAPTLDSLIKTQAKVWFLADLAEGGDTLNRDDAFVRDLRGRHAGLQLTSANGALQQMRGTKSAAELELLRKAIAISADAHREAMRAVRPGMNEFEIQALVEYVFRRNGADRPGYASIVGSGPNATTLHYNRDDRFMQAGDMMVMDVGALYQGYSADLTRSFPISGTFTPEQREVYAIVREAQAAAERNAKPGQRWAATSDSASRVIARGLARLGLIEAADATYDCGTSERPRTCPQSSLYYMHGLGHGIGLEVHDPDQYYFSGIIATGSAFSLEPGIYVRANLVDIIPDTPANAALRRKLTPVVQKYANIGVRIEDNYLVTEQGLEWASCGLPREIDEIETLMKERTTGPSARDATKVEWYRTAGSPRAGSTPGVVPAAGCGPRM
ncbi:MAG: aminopeptidase P N-terminal domain-containing protein [Gemmatimonadaceae bacterium]|nr:aminopeptidase P N-terminal domain-containing protein [Gemmatimonadaceae bacterium]